MGERKYITISQLGAALGVSEASILSVMATGPLCEKLLISIEDFCSLASGTSFTKKCKAAMKQQAGKGK